ncbi:carboxymuconolactone decarboxylase family protein [Aestuariibius insulae]|uniref:carboxymuconolactone decarboxylase family protein n=1 Tax=Aestuariibius insulae TaxID=2058287 RepID=UPI00345EEACA
MALVSPLSDAELDPDLAEKVQFFKGPLGVVPNSIRTMAWRPEIAEAYTALNVAVMKPSEGVTAEFKRLIGYASSFASGCMYCRAHMILASERFGASEERLAAVSDPENSGVFSEAEVAALVFARAASEVPNAVTDEIGARLTAHWSDADVIEIMAVIALFGYLNRWNDSMGSALEDLPVEAGERLLDGTGWEIGKHI